MVLREYYRSQKLQKVCKSYVTGAPKLMSLTKESALKAVFCSDWSHVL